MPSLEKKHEGWGNRFFVLQRRRNWASRYSRGHESPTSRKEREKWAPGTRQLTLSGRCAWIRNKSKVARISLDARRYVHYGRITWTS